MDTIFKYNLSSEENKKMYDSLHPNRKLNAIGGDNNGSPILLNEASVSLREVRDDYNSNINAVMLSPKNETNF
jgi:hypothetical protein